MAFTMGLPMSTVSVRERPDAFTREQVASFCIISVNLVNTIGYGAKYATVAVGIRGRCGIRRCGST